MVVKTRWSFLLMWGDICEINHDGQRCLFHLKVSGAQIYYHLHATVYKPLMNPRRLTMWRGLFASDQGNVPVVINSEKHKVSAQPAEVGGTGGVQFLWQDALFLRARAGIECWQIWCRETGQCVPPKQNRSFLV